jgi:hypothetical protein
VAALRDDGWLRIGARLLALRSSYTLRRGGDLARDEERELRRLHVQRRRQLEALARLYSARS